MFREREASSVRVLRVLRGVAEGEAAPRLLCCLLWAADIGAWRVLGTGAVPRIYALLRPLRNVRALLPPLRFQRRCQGASKQCAVRRGSRRATRGVRGRR